MTQFFHAYHGVSDRDLQVRMARVYRRRCPSLNWTAPHCSQPRRPGKIRVGIVSAFLDGNTIGRLWNGLISRLDPNRFDVTIYVYRSLSTGDAHPLAKRANRVRTLPQNHVFAREIVAPLRPSKIQGSFNKIRSRDPCVCFVQETLRGTNYNMS